MFVGWAVPTLIGPVGGAHLLQQGKRRIAISANQLLTLAFPRMIEFVLMGDEQHFDEILAAITSSGALNYTRHEAEKAAQRAAAAISGLPNSQFKDSLLQLSAFAVDRNH